MGWFEYEARKRAFDVVVAGILLVIALPLMFFIAIMVRTTSPGPVIYKQSRLGTNNKSFLMWKFRTMYLNGCDKGEVSGEPRRNDPRITWVGAFLRCTHLDELPQLLHVLRGEMSIVGLRPMAKIRAVELGYLMPQGIKPGCFGPTTALRGTAGRAMSLRREDVVLRMEEERQFASTPSMRKDLDIIWRSLVAVWWELFPSKKEAVLAPEGAD